MITVVRRVITGLGLRHRGSRHDHGRSAGRRAGRWIRSWYFRRSMFRRNTKIFSGR